MGLMLVLIVVVFFGAVVALARPPARSPGSDVAPGVAARRSAPAPVSPTDDGLRIVLVAGPRE